MRFQSGVVEQTRPLLVQSFVGYKKVLQADVVWIAFVVGQGFAECGEPGC